jgi:hypothetical protein
VAVCPSGMCQTLLHSCISGATCIAAATLLCNLLLLLEQWLFMQLLAHASAAQAATNWYIRQSMTR